MKVLFVTREYPPFEVGGVAVHTFNLVRNLKKLGVSCNVISFGDPKYSNDEVCFLEPHSSIISKTDCSTSSDSRIPFDIMRMTEASNYLIRTKGFDVVHVQEPYVGAFLRHRQKVTTIHDTSYGDIRSILHSKVTFPDLKRLVFYFSLGFFLESMCVASSSILITPSEQMKKELVDVYRVSKSKVKVLRNGVDSPEPTKLKSKDKAKERLGLPSDKLLIFTASQHMARKRLDTLLEAVFLLQKRQVGGYNVVIAGDGPLRPSLIDLSKKLGLDEVVAFPGWVSREQLNLYFQAADIFVLTSEYEAGPISLLEAMSFGNAVVSSRINGFPGSIVNNVDGVLFPVGDCIMLAKCLESLLNNTSLRTKLSASARVFAKRFDWKSVAEDTVVIYETLC